MKNERYEPDRVLVVGLTCLLVRYRACKSGNTANQLDELTLNFEFVTKQKQLEAMIGAMKSAPWIAFDTEFVSEFTYYPELCLIQVAMPEGLWVVDTLELPEIDAFWLSLCKGEHLTIVHAGREEIMFCHRAVGRSPKHWFDAQLAAGMIGLEYPASYGKIILRLLNERLAKGETRTDWRLRPLSDAQLKYALNDVIYLKPVHDALGQQLEALGRLDWFEHETTSWRHRLLEVDPKQRWRRVSGSGNLSSKKLAIVRELWQWREREAIERNVPAKRVLRDDLIVELAKRGSDTPDQVRAIRGIQRRDINPHIPAIARCVRDAATKPIESTRVERPQLPKQVDALAQFLSTALASMCREKSISPQIVGTMQDVKDLIVHHLKLNSAVEPKLLSDWRLDFVGNALVDAIDGKVSLRIHDPLSEFPISIDPT